MFSARVLKLMRVACLLPKLVNAPSGLACIRWLSRTGVGVGAELGLKGHVNALFVKPFYVFLQARLHLPKYTNRALITRCVRVKANNERTSQL